MKNKITTSLVLTISLVVHIIIVVFQLIFLFIISVFAIIIFFLTWLAQEIFSESRGHEEESVRNIKSKCHWQK